MRYGIQQSYLIKNVLKQQGIFEKVVQKMSFFTCEDNSYKVYNNSSEARDILECQTIVISTTSKNFFSQRD